MEAVVESCIILVSNKHDISPLKTIDIILKYANKEYSVLLRKIKRKYQETYQLKIVAGFLSEKISRDLVGKILNLLEPDQVRALCIVNKYMQKICTEKFWILYYDNKFKDKTKLLLYLLQYHSKYAIPIYRKYQKDIDITRNHNEAFRLAAEFGYFDLVKELLQNPKINPSDSKNWAIKAAIKNGHLKVVKELLKNNQIDPDISQTLNLAVKYGHYQIAKELLNSKRLTVSDTRYHEPIYFAAKNNRVKIMKLLLDDTRLDPSIKKNEAIITAAENGYIEIVKELLKDTRVNPTDFNNASITRAARKGHLEVTKALMDKVNPAYPKNRALRWAFENGHLNVVKQLLKDDRVKKGAKKVFNDPKVIAKVKKKKNKDQLLTFAQNY